MCNSTVVFVVFGVFVPGEREGNVWGILKCELEDDEIDVVIYFGENYVVGKLKIRFRK